MTKEQFNRIRLLNHCSLHEVHLESGAPYGGIRTFRMGKKNMTILESWCDKNANPEQIDWDFLESIRKDKPMNFMDHIIGLNYGTYGYYMKGIRPFRANYLKIIEFQKRRKHVV